MSTERVLAELNLSETTLAGTAWAYGYWFSYAYYVSPALLAEQEAPSR